MKRDYIAGDTKTRQASKPEYENENSDVIATEQGSGLAEKPMIFLFLLYYIHYKKYRSTTRTTEAERHNIFKYNYRNRLLNIIRI